MPPNNVRLVEAKAAYGPGAGVAGQEQLLFDAASAAADVPAALAVCPQSEAHPVALAVVAAGGEAPARCRAVRDSATGALAAISGDRGCDQVDGRRSHPLRAAPGRFSAADLPDAEVPLHARPRRGPEASAGDRERVERSRLQDAARSPRDGGRQGAPQVL